MNLNFLVHEPILILTIDCMNSLLEVWSHFMHLRHELPEKHSKEVVVHRFLKLPQHSSKFLGLEVGQYLFCSCFTWLSSFHSVETIVAPSWKSANEKDFWSLNFRFFPKWASSSCIHCNVIRSIKTICIHCNISMSTRKISDVERKLSEGNFMESYFRCRVSDRCHVDPGICRKYRLVLGRIS